MKKLLIFLLLVPLAFAASWQEIAGMAIMLSVALLAIVFAVGYGFSISEMQMMAKEEFFQLIALALMMVVLIGADGLLNSISQTLSPTTDTMQKASLDILQDNRGLVAALVSAIGNYDLDVSKESSKSTQCNIMYMGYSVSGCGGYTMLAPPLSMAGGIAGFAMGELSGMERLIQLADRYALSLLLPAGIILRTFKITRGGGGFLIALGISLHIMLPVGVIFNEMLVETFKASDDTRVDQYTQTIGSVSVEECDPANTQPPPLGLKISTAWAAWAIDEIDTAISGGTNEEKAIRAYRKMRLITRNKLLIILLKATLGPIIALLLMATSIRTLTSIAGAEVDVSAISRLV